MLKVDRGLPFSKKTTSYPVTRLPPAGVVTAVQEIVARPCCPVTAEMFTEAGPAGITSALKGSLQLLTSEVPMALVALTVKRNRCPVGKPSREHTVEVHSLRYPASLSTVYFVIGELLAAGACQDRVRFPETNPAARVGA